MQDETKQKYHTRAVVLKVDPRTMEQVRDAGSGLTLTQGTGVLGVSQQSCWNKPPADARAVRAEDPHPGDRSVEKAVSPDQTSCDPGGKRERPWGELSRNSRSEYREKVHGDIFAAEVGAPA